MEIKAMGQTDPSSFTAATVYVFDASGAKILEKDFPIDLPAPKPDPAPVSTPSVQPVNTTGTTAVPTVPKASTSPNMPPEATVPTIGPVDDPSLTGGAKPEKREDTRSRF
jgi:hypothetical protein